jgi:dUTP pyrophosphatase
VVSPVVRIHRESEFKDIPLPQYATEQSAGVDLHAAIRSEVVLNPGQWRLISTGIRIAIPPGFEGQVRPRSGLALKYGVTLLNTPGTIDSDYRGIVGVIMINLGDAPFVIHRSDRIAQLVISPISRLTFDETEVLSSTQRGAQGFGSSGFTKSIPAKHLQNDTIHEIDEGEYAQENDVTLPGGMDR